MEDKRKRARKWKKGKKSWKKGEKRKKKEDYVLTKNS